MEKVGILGASGYAGLELTRLLEAHPRTELVWAGANREAGRMLTELDPQGPELRLMAMEDCPLEEAETIFACLPHAASQEWVNEAQSAGAVVIDLSADFRLDDRTLYEKTYATEHIYPDLLKEALYGLTEWVRDDLPGKRVVACPGCYPTSILLALMPLKKHLKGTVIADSKSGVSGAGRGLNRTTHFGQVHDNFTPYKIGDQHRHRVEVCEKMGWADLLFTPHLLPVFRGILSTIYLPWQRDFDARTLLEEKYSQENFVKVLPEGEIASLAQVVNTNRCAISLHPTDSHLILVSAIDNLQKGAAGQALQNLNAVAGWPETEGLVGW